MTHDSEAPSFGSAVRDVRLACLILSLMTCLALAFSASPASATYLHSNLPTHEFGPDGTDNFTSENSFYANTLNGVAVDSQRRRLYVMSHKDPGNQGRVWPGAAHGLYGYDISDPDNPTPLGGDFPLAIPQNQNGESWLAVDPSDGTLYMLEKAEVCYCEPGGTLYSWDLEGKPRPGFPMHIDKQGPFAVDLSGYLWVWRTQNNYAVSHIKLRKYLPDGTFVEEFDPNVSGIGSPRNLTFDGTSGDMWLQFSEAAVKFTADSNYAYHEPPVSVTSADEAGFAIDSGNDILYNVHYSFWGNGIEALNERGGRAEDVFGLGGTGDYNYNPPPAGCGGYCPPRSA